MVRTSKGGRQRRPLAAGSTVAALVLLVGATVQASAQEPVSTVPLRPELAAQLAAATPEEQLLVLVSGATTEEAVAAVDASSLQVVEVFHRIAVVAALGSAEAILDLHRQPGVRRVDANLELELLDDVAHRSTGVAPLRDPAAYPGLRRLRASGETPYDGTGVSIAIVDAGFDTTHEQFVRDGRSKFDVHLRQACPVDRENVFIATGTDPLEEDCSQWVPAPPAGDDVGGHGTMVGGVAAGEPRTTPGGQAVSGVAPGARLVGLSTGVPEVLGYSVVSALNWVLGHHADPCGDRRCPAIRVVSMSVEPNRDFEPEPVFEPDAPIASVTTKLVEAGVVVVFGAGNSRGDGTSNKVSRFALHPLPGVLGAGAFSDSNAGDRNAGVWARSSRGSRGDPSTYPDVVAPGELVLTGCPSVSVSCSLLAADGSNVASSGTSFAAPYVAGAVAQLLQANPSLTPAAVEDILEDTAYQGFIERSHLEADRYIDATDVSRANPDHTTSFEAGHGLVDLVAALGAVVTGGSRPAPEPCPGRTSEATIVDPSGDTRVVGQGGVPLDQPGSDIVGVAASLLQNPGALTVTVSYRDLPERIEPVRTTLIAHLDGRFAEVDFRRAPVEEPVRLLGPVVVDARADPAADTVTFVLRLVDGNGNVMPIRERAGMASAYTTNDELAEHADFTHGMCSVWL